MAKTAPDSLRGPYPTAPRIRPELPHRTSTPAARNPQFCYGNSEKKKQSLLPSTDQNCPIRMPVFQCFSPPVRWPFLEFNTGATPSFPPPPPPPSSSSSFSSSSPPHHLFSEVDDVYIASSGCSGGRLDPNPIASSECCERRLDRTPYRERRMLWRAPGPEIMSERMPKRRKNVRKNVRMEYQIYVR